MNAINAIRLDIKAPAAAVGAAAMVVVTAAVVVAAVVAMAAVVVATLLCDGLQIRERERGLVEEPVKASWLASKE